MATPNREPAKTVIAPQPAGLGATGAAQRPTVLTHRDFTGLTGFKFLRIHVPQVDSDPEGIVRILELNRNPPKPSNELIRALSGK